MTPTSSPTSLQFFGLLRWIDGRPLLDTIEPYRREIFKRALDTYRLDGVPEINFVLCGRAKKNWKSSDLVFASLYCLMFRDSPQGNDCYILANDEDQANDDLGLAKKLVSINPDLADELIILTKEIRRKDGKGSLTVLPARDAIGAHGKTAAFIGYDELHGYRSYDLLEALAPDPTRADAMTWMATYDTVYNTPGVPLVDLKKIGRDGSDERMLFSWYSADICTDEAFADLEPELRANPSIASWPEGRKYLEQQKRRLPTHKYRRLHLNLPGAPNGAFLDQGAVLDATIEGRHSLPPQDGTRYTAFVDMSGGSNDDATLCVSHKEEKRVVVDLVIQQSGPKPFNPRDAVRKFAAILKDYRISRVVGDNYAGEVFKRDFLDEKISYQSSKLSATELYEYFEPKLNAGEIVLPDVSKLQEQLLTLVVRGTRVTHQNGDHDDYANSVAGAVWCASQSQGMHISAEVLARARTPGAFGPNSPGGRGLWGNYALSGSGGSIGGVVPGSMDHRRQLQQRGPTDDSRLMQLIKEDELQKGKF